MSASIKFGGRDGSNVRRSEPGGKSQRYAGAPDFSADIERFLVGEPVLAYRETVMERLDRLIHRETRNSVATRRPEPHHKAAFCEKEHLCLVVIHFEIPADNLEPAVEFYKVGSLINGRAAGLLAHHHRKGRTGHRLGACYGRPHTRAGTVNTIGVASLDDALQQVHEAGGKTVLPRLAIPGVGYLAHCQDTEGNTFGTMQANPSAK